MRLSGMGWHTCVLSDLQVLNLHVRRFHCIIMYMFVYKVMLHGICWERKIQVDSHYPQRFCSWNICGYQILGENISQVVQCPLSLKCNWRLALVESRAVL